MDTILAGGQETLARAEYTLRLHRHAGSAPDHVPVLLIHPALGSFRGLSEGLQGSLPDAVAARGCRVFGFDLAGHGLSDPLPEFPEDFIERSVDDTLAALDALAVARAAAVGIGTGGLVALLAAARAPDRFSCVLADSPPGIVAAVSFEPWDREDGQRADGYDVLPAWLRYLGSLRSTPRLDPPPLPVLLMACRGRSGLPERAGSWRTVWAPCLRPAAYRGAPEFFVRELERFLAANA